MLQRCVGGGPVERESTNIIYLLLCVSLVLLVHMYSTAVLKSHEKINDLIQRFV